MDQHTKTVVRTAAIAVTCAFAGVLFMIAVAWVDKILKDMDDCGVVTVQTPEGPND